MKAEKAATPVDPVAGTEPEEIQEVITVGEVVITPSSMDANPGIAIIHAAEQVKRLIDAARPTSNPIRITVTA